MKLQTKTLQLTVISFLLLGISTLLMAYFIFSKQFETIEKNAVDTDIKRLVNNIHYFEKTLSATVAVSAYWDEAYNYIKYKNDKAIVSDFNSNFFTTSTLADYHLNLFSFWDNEGKLVGGLYASNKSAEFSSPPLTIPLEIQNEVYRNKKRLITDQIVPGWILTKDGPLLLTSCPVLRNDHGGPRIGVLIGGILLNQATISDIKKISQIAFSTRPISTMSHKELINFSSQPKIRLHDNKIEGSLILQDLNHQPLVKIIIDENRNIYNKSMEVFAYFVGSLFLLCAITAVIINFILKNNVIKPICHLREQTKLIAANKLSEVSLQSKDEIDEISDLTFDLNHMLNNIQETHRNLEKTYKKLTEELTLRKNIEQRLVQAEKMEALGTLTGGIAHDFNNILWMIMGNSEILLELSKEQPDLYDIEQDILAATQRAKGLVQQLLDFSRKGKTDDNKQRLNIIPLIKETAKMVMSIIPSSIEFKIDIDETEQCILCDPTKIHQIIMNLCTNAYHAMREHNEHGQLSLNLKEVCLTKSAAQDEDILRKEELKKFTEHYLMIEVQDTGCGIPPEILPRIFDPFFTTKEVGSGTGLGLATLHGIVKEMNGQVTVDSQVGQGTVFRIYLPVLHTDSTSNQETQNLSNTPQEVKKRQHIVVVDDEPLILQMLSKMLDKLGYEVTTFSQPAEALKALEANGNQYDLVITDFNMPKITGVELAKSILKTAPSKPIVLFTGYRNMISPTDLQHSGIKKLMDKPLNLTDLNQMLQELLQAS